MKKLLIPAITSYLAKYGWSMDESKRTLTRWQKSDGICLLQLVLVASRRKPGTFEVHFTAYILLDIWKDVLMLGDGMKLPIFDVYGGIAKQSGFMDDYTYDGVCEFKGGEDIIGYLTQHLYFLESTYLNAQTLLLRSGFTGDTTAFINAVPPHWLATTGQLLLAVGQTDEAKELLSAYARRLFNGPTKDKLLEALEQI
jgi:hypothetical protein